MSICSVKFSPDGKTLASACKHRHRCGDVLVLTVLIIQLASDKLIKLWSPFTGQIIRTLEGHTEGLNDVAWSSDSAFLASASDDKTVRIWNVDTVSTRYVLGLQKAKRDWSRESCRKSCATIQTTSSA